MRKKIVSIIVPALNSEKTIALCVNSLLNQNYQKSKYEIIVVDNGSKDKTLKILKKYKDKIKILHELKRGSYSARNEGIKKAKGSIFAFTDSDCVADSLWISNISKSFRGPVKVVGGKIQSFETSTTLLRYCNLFCHPHSLSGKAPRPYFGTSNLAVNVKNIKTKPYFDDSLRSGGDIKFCLRIIKNKDELYYNPNALVRHIYSKSIVDFAKKSFLYGLYKGYMARNMEKYHSTRLPGHLDLLINYGLRFLFIRLVQDLSHKSGFLIGYFKKLPKQPKNLNQSISP